MASHEDVHIDYRDSHRDEGKGAQYEEYYKTDRWNVLLWRREQEILDEIFDRWHVAVHPAILDFACGTGRVSEYLISKTDSFMGIDISDTMLSEARRKMPGVEFILGDIVEDRQLLEGRRFDMITAFRFFVNAQPSLRNAVLRRLSGMLMADGRLVFNVHHHLGSPYVRLVRWSERRHEKTYNTMSLDEVYALLDDVDLRPVEIYGTGLAHIPKIKFPESLSLPIDRTLAKLPGSYRVAEDLIVVAKRG